MINKIVCKIDLSWTFVSYLSFGYNLQVVNIESCLTKLIQALDEEERDVGVGFLSGAGQKKNFGGTRQGKARQKQK